MPAKKGLFIVFEGPDRSGKSTQMDLLADFLKKNKKKFILTREPGGEALSEKIREILLDPKNNISPLSELFLYEASRAQHVSEKIKPSLKKGISVISDRFFLATMAYQGYGRNIPLKTVKQLNLIASGGLKPDLTFLFMMPDSEFKKREKELLKGKNPKKADRMEREKDSFRKKVNSAYGKIAKLEKNIIVIDASKSKEQIHLIIAKHLKGKIK